MNIRTGLFFLLFIVTLYAPAQNTLVRTPDEEVYRTGIELLDHEKYGAAREFFQRYIELRKGDLRTIDAEYYVALCALNLFNSDAEALFQNFIINHPYHSKASLAYYDLGSFYYTKQQYQKAIDYFDKSDVTKLTASQKTERSFKLGYAYFNLKDFEKAESHFNEIKGSSNKYTYAASYYAGYIELKNGKYSEALVDLKKAEENDAYKPIVPAMIANVYYWQGNYDELISYAEKLLSSSDKNIQGKDEIFLLTADAYYNKGNYKKAAEYFQKLISENRAKATVDIKYRYGHSLYKNRDMAGAINQFKDVAGNQDSIQQAAAYYLGLAYLQEGKKDFALPAFDLARKVEFSKTIQEEALFYFGKINFELKRYHDAISALKSFSKQFPNSTFNNEVQELLSESFLRTSNYQEAISYIESLKVRSLRINKAYQSVTFYSGVQLFNNEKFPEAIQMFDKSTEFPIDKDILIAATFWKAEAYEVMKDYSNAINNYSIVFQKTNDDNPYYLKTRYGIGYAYYNTKEYDKALPHFKKYVEELRNAKDKQYYDDALLRLADLYFQRKLYDQALEYYNQAINSKIKDLDHAYYFRGVVLGTDQKIPEAIKSLDVVIGNYPQSIYYDDAIYEKSQLQFQTGDLEAAAKGFSKIINEIPNSTYYAEALLRRAGVYSNLNRNQDAVADYKTIVSKFPSTPLAEEALTGLLQEYNTIGDLEATKQWQDTLAKVNPQSETLINSKFTTASNLYFAHKYPQAIEAFNSYLENYPETANTNLAHYNLADAYANIGDTSNSIKNYQFVVDSKDERYALKSVGKIADLEFKQGKYAEAKDYYKVLAANASNKKDKTNALLGLMQIYYNLKNYDSTIAYATEIKALGNATLDAESKSLLYTGKAYYEKQDFNKAIDYFLNTVNHAKDRNAVEAQYLIAEIQYNQKKYRQSLETLNQLNNNFSSYEDWIDKSFLLIADNLIAMNETFQAKATLNSIIENSSNKQVIEKAKEKLAQLEGKENGNNE